MKQIRINFIAYILCLFVFGCGDYSVDLPNSYQLVRLSGFEVVIIDTTRHVVVEPNIDNYAVVEDVVIGHVSLPEHGKPTDSVPGFFLLNTRTNSVQVGLTKEQWEAQVARSNIKDYKLIKPSRFN